MDSVFSTRGPFLPPLAGPALVVLGDVDELAPAARAAGDDRQLADLADGTGPEAAAGGRPRRRPGDGDQRPGEDHRARRRRAHLEVLRDLDRLNAARSLDDGAG